MASARVRFCFFDDSFDEIYAASRRCLTGTADAAENDDVSDAGNDALDDVERARRTAFILVFR